ncbi:ABC transporter permease [Brevibacillus ginsengisoli]|uniref:ABC transporter permease n=1 Tax=Brevibacillus ginsengisoli TaxID=363854 RepID=UPI003CF3E186
MQPIDTKQIHLAYVKQEKRMRLYVFLTQLIIFALFMSLWEWVGRVNAINVLLFSYPSKMWALFVEKLLDGSLLPHLYTTVYETAVGFILGTLLGTLFAAVIWWFPFLSRVLDPYLVVLNSMPKVAFGPLFIVGFGPGFFSIIAMGFAISVIITTIVIYNSFKEVNQNYIKVVQTLGGNKRQIFTLVILPATVPAIVSTLKVNVGLSWVGVITGEFLVSQSGLGYLIIYGFQVFNFTLVSVTVEQQDHLLP